jgi:replication-associated recombination protein RarA
MIFVGNAGTGKTDAARITFEYLNSLGVLTKGVFKEVSKADFISDNIGETAKATLNIVNSAIGGVLFIDEAYSLQENESDIKGKIILETLMKSIEDHKDDLIVILAGYKKDMSTLLTYNQGLKSRFPNVITFNDYSPEEMYEIALIIAKNKGYNIDGNVKNDLIDLFTRNQVTERKSLGNARFVRNVIENAILDASKKYFSDPLRKIDLLDKSNFNFNFKAKFDLEQKLKNIIGLDEVKNLIRSQYKLLAAQEKRKSVGVATEIEQNLNMVFAGNPGTGKTSIARLVAEMLNSMGFLKRGQLIETDRSGFVSDIPGETSKKTEEKFKEAIGGILFIDEAYTLANDSLGREAIETLLKLIEDYSKEVIVILAGYNKEMEDFFDVNIGLRSRFPLWTTFEDYNPEELFIMAIRLLTSKGFKLSSNAYKELKKSFVDIYENSDMQSGNGRMVRNYAENLIRIQSIRVAEEDISVYEMNLITSKDVEKLIFSEQDSSYDLEKSLEKISGNEKSKEFLRNQYKLFKINEKRKRMGISSDINKYMNTLFTGEMGTGKQIILNAYAEMLYSIGIIKSKSPIEISVDEIILSLSGGKKMEDILSKGIGKIFFIDKAPLFMHEKNFSSISSEIIKFIDRNRNKLVIIFNGEKDEMKKMMEISPPLSYRFSTSLDFEDYSLDDLKAMAIKILLDKGYTMDEKCKEILGRIIGELNENKSIIIKNGLMIKQFLDNTIRAQSVRIYDEWESKEKINLIETTDLLKGKSMFLDKNS